MSNAFIPATKYDILVVEDNQDARETLSLLLELSGHRVEAAVDGPAGLAKAFAARPRIVLVDIGLPGMDGYEVARRIRADEGWSDGRPFLIALTGYGSPDDQRRASEAGFDLHLVKPVQPEALEEVLSRCAPP